MKFDDWEPFYDAILDDFGYSRADDRRSARLLDSLLGSDIALHELRSLLADASVVVVGDAPLLDAADVPHDSVVVAADGAAERLADAGVGPDVVVTDLDGAPEYAAEASHSGTLAVVHAHGDNRDALERYVPDFDTDRVVGTTQARPFGVLYNFGGFTDGDRAVFLADSLGAREIRLVGFDFDAAEGEKLRKLRWARRLVRVVSEERGEVLVHNIIPR